MTFEQQIEATTNATTFVGEPNRPRVEGMPSRPQVLGEPLLQSIEGTCLQGETVALLVQMGTFEAAETWTSGGGSGTVSGTQAHGGVLSGRLINEADLARLAITPDLDLTGATQITLWTWGELLTPGLPALGNSLDFRLRLFDATVKAASYTIAGILTENTANDQWVERTILIADMTVDPGFNWAAVDYVEIVTLNNVSVRQKTLYVDDIEAS